MRRRRRRRKNTRRASNKDSEIFAGQLFSCPVFSREDEDRRRRPRSARECSKTHSVLSPLSPGSNFIFTQVSGSGLPVFFIQNFYCYRKTAALLHASRAQKGGCLTIPDLLSGTQSQNPPHSGTVSRSPTPRDSLPRSLRSAQMSPEGRSFRPHEA